MIMPITQCEGKYGDALKLLKPHLPAIGLLRSVCSPMIGNLNTEQVTQLPTIFLNLERVTVTTAVIIVVTEPNVKGYYFIPNGFAIIIFCKWQILPSQFSKAIKKTIHQHIFRKKMNFKYITRLSAFFLLTFNKMSKCIFYRFNLVETSNISLFFNWSIMK